MSEIYKHIVLECKKCGVRGHARIYTSSLNLFYRAGVYDVWEYKFSWSSATRRNGKIVIGSLSDACPHMIYYAVRWFTENGYKEFSEDLIRDFLGEDVLITLHGWKLMPSISSQAVSVFAVSDSHQRFLMKSTFEEALKEWEKLSEYYKGVAKTKIEMVIQGFSEKCVEIREVE